MKEIWRPIKALNNRYDISNYGRVRKVAETIMRSNGRAQAINERVLTPIPNNGGYLKVRCSATVGARPKNIYIHKTVAFYFVRGYFGGAQVNHKDGNKQNNRADNLEWCTPKENIQHAWSNGLSGPTNEIPITVNGIKYKSIQQAATALNVSRHVMYYQIQKHGKSFNYKL